MSMLYKYKNNQLVKSLPPYLFLTDSNRAHNPSNIVMSLAKGYGVIFRDYHLKNPEREILAINILRICRELGIFFIFGGSFKKAIQLGAHGVHIPRWAHKTLMPKTRPHQFIVTTSVHSQAELLIAKTFKPDAFIISPVFKTKNVPEPQTLGLRGLMELVKAADGPCYALGGINKRNIRQIPKHHNLIGVAGTTIFCEAIKNSD